MPVVEGEDHLPVKESTTMEVKKLLQGGGLVPVVGGEEHLPVHVITEHQHLAIEVIPFYSKGKAVLTQYGYLSFLLLVCMHC